MPRAVTQTDLGAWLIKCDPRVNSELLEPHDGGVARITSRCVVPGYRASMMKRGDRVVLWVSGADRRTRGIRGAGSVTGVVEGPKRDLSAPVEILLFAAPLTDVELRSAGVHDLEVQRMPAGSNPSWVSMAQWEQMAPLLDTRARVRTHHGTS